MEGFDAKTNRKFRVIYSVNIVFLETPGVNITPKTNYRFGSKSKLGEKNGSRA